MGVNKVEYFGTVLIDLTNDTVAPETMFEGTTAHDKNGAKVTGTFTLEEEMTEQNGLISQISALVASKANPDGGNIKMCTVTLTKPSHCLTPDPPTYYYTDAETMTIKSLETSDDTITVPVNTIIAITPWSDQSVGSGSCERIFYCMGYSAYKITGNCTLTYWGM